MKRYLSIFVLALLVTMVFATSCRDDILLEPLPTLEGTYDGAYIVITGYKTTSADTSISTLEMRFSDESYWFDSDNSPDNFCSPRGSYILTNSMELTETNDGCNVTAKERDNPRGAFSIRRPGDSVIMLQQLEPDTLKQILLIKR
ncbi:MAG: hypothetical protein IIC66_11645 [candidate division Zixibacteria bacterium]|nr:hypothetical protein [candidate division Zixibacteria bacterium]